MSYIQYMHDGLSKSKQIKILKFDGTSSRILEDQVSLESPLEIRITRLDSRPYLKNKSISITMRSPGQDKELAVGFLFSEGILTNLNQIKTIKAEENTVDIYVQDCPLNLNSLERHFYMSSSCGVCGKSSIESVMIHTKKKLNDNIRISSELLISLPEILKQQQAEFNTTGGIHAAGLFDISGDLLFITEDVGRHNALDKLIGMGFLHDKLPFNECVLLLSGRASFELIQKAAMAEIPIVAAVGAPSSLAIELAEKSGITLLGFLRQNRFNIYSHFERIKT